MHSDDDNTDNNNVQKKNDYDELSVFPGHRVAIIKRQERGHNYSA